jgi:hypothetical protein
MVSESTHRSSRKLYRWIERLTPSVRHIRHRHSTLAARALLISALAMTFATPALARGPIAQPSRVLNATDTAHLSYNARESEGATLVEEGVARGKLPGSMRARLSIEGTFSGSFVLRTSGGTLKGHGSATPSGSGRYESFRGSLVISGGTGRYARAHGKAGLYGIYDRDTHGFTVQTTGSISY